MKLPLPTHSVYSFTWGAPASGFGNWHGVVDASDLGYKCGDKPYAPVYDDACDVGFAVWNEKTDTLKTFTLVRENTSEGELLSWDFIDTDNQITIRIFND